MAALEWRIISEVLRDQNWHTVVKLGLNKEHFRDGEARTIFEYLRKHYYHPDTYKEFPTIQQIKRRFPGFQLTAKGGDEEGKVATLIRELKLGALSNDLQSLANSIQEIAQDDEPEEALKLLRSMVGSISFKNDNKGAVGIDQIARIARQQYSDAKAGLAYGIPWPWEPLTYDTMGKNPSQLILIYARQKQMKTWVQLLSAIEDFMVHKRRVLFWSKEMGVEEICVRIAVILAKVDYQLTVHGALPALPEARYFQALDYFESVVGRSDEEREESKKRHTEDFILLAGGDAPRTVAEARSALEMHEVDIGYFDSAHHLDPEKGGRHDNEKQRYLAEAMKEVAIDTKLPIVCTYHANRLGEKAYGDTMSDIGRTDAWGGEVDLGIRVVKGPTKENVFEEEYEGQWEREAEAKKRRMEKRAMLVPLKVNQVKNGAPDKAKIKVKEALHSQRKPRTSAELALLISGGRRGVLPGILIKAIPGYDFRLLRDSITADEVRQLMEADDETGGTRSRTPGTGKRDSYKPNLKAMSLNKRDRPGRA